MRKLACIAVIGSFATTTGAFAQDFDGLFIEGYAEASNVWRGSDSDSFFAIDTDFGYRAANAGGFGSIGFTFGTEYFSDSDTDIEAFYGSLDIGLGPGTLSLGSPRSVFDRGYISDYQIGLSSVMQLNLSGATGSTYRSVYYIADGKTRGGLRWDGTYGNTLIGASYNAYEFFGTDLSSTALAVRHEYGAVGAFDSVAAFAAVEVVDIPSGTETNTALGTDLGLGPWTLGLNLHREEALAGADTITTHANYNFGNGLEIDASFATFDTDAFNANLFGLAFRYTLDNGFFLDASYIDTDIPGIDDVFDVALGFDF
jgi:hypothetical protein